MYDSLNPLFCEVFAAVVVCTRSMLLWSTYQCSVCVYICHLNLEVIEKFQANNYRLPHWRKTVPFAHGNLRKFALEFLIEWWAPWVTSCFTYECSSSAKRIHRFRYIKFGLAVRVRGHKQRKLNGMLIHLFCLCPPGLTIKLNFNISNVASSTLCYHSIFGIQF